MRPRDGRLRVLAVAAVGLAACEKSHGPADGGGGDAGPDPIECAVSSDCIVVPASCCGSCGAATRGDAIAVNRGLADAYRVSVCGEEFGCPACYMEQDPTLVATCTGARCAVVDVLAQPFAECSADDECRIRTHDCCECGGDVTSAGIIAIRPDGNAAYMDVVCDDGAATPCTECAPTYPAEVAAVCDGADGVCHALWRR